MTPIDLHISGTRISPWEILCTEEWKGPWSDDSKEWTDEAKEKFDLKVKNDARPRFTS